MNIDKTWTQTIIRLEETASTLFSEGFAEELAEVFAKISGSALKRRRNLAQMY
jgi:hypothetical protein